MKIAPNHVLLLQKSTLACRRSGGGLELQCRRVCGCRSPNSAARRLRCWLRICCVTPARAFGQPGDYGSPGMPLGQSPLPFTMITPSNCMTVWREKLWSTSDLQESRGITVKLPTGFPALQSRKVFFPLCFTLQISLGKERREEGLELRVLPVQRCVFKIAQNHCNFLVD